MLIYNFQKEFIGIEEKDLRALGFQDLAELKAEVSDFADLFVKTPGYIHNFKHVHWIDFITCAESNEESKVIINVNNKNYKCILQITTAFLMDNPTSKAYLVALHNLRELTAKESESVSGDIVERQVSQNIEAVKPIFNTPEYSDEFTHDAVFKEETLSPTVVQDPYETPLEIDAFKDEEIEEEQALQDEVLDIDESLDVKFEDNLNVDFNDDISINTEAETQIKGEPQVSPPPAKTQIIHENFDNGYVYDPSVASNELGLPLDLIEEFIQDFIEQAKEFKADLYKALDENDLDNLKTLSHKLKGVAANLRIEDALEALTIANTANDTAIIGENLNIFYKIIAKLSGEEVTSIKEIPYKDEQIQETMNLDADLLDLDFKDEIPKIQDNRVPQQKDAPIDLLDMDTFKDDLFESDVPHKQEDRVDESPIHIDFSKEHIAHEIGIDVESFDELFHDYIQEAESISVKLKDAVSSEDFATCKKEALSFKGMSDNMRITLFTKELDIVLLSHSVIEVSQAINKIDAIISQLKIQGV